MTQHLAAIEAAIKAKAPIVAIPIEGHAPLCIRQKLLKGALKGVSILTVEVIELSVAKVDELKRYGNYSSGNRALKITGRAGNVRTSCTLYTLDRRTAVKELGKWSDQERKKEHKRLMLGALATPQGKRAAKLKEMEGVVSDALTQAKNAERDLIHSRKPLTTDERRIVGLNKPISEEAAMHLVAHHAVPKHIIKQCAVLRYRNAQTTAVIRKVAKYDPSRRRTSKRPFLRAKAASQLIALVSELMARKAELARIAPPSLPHPRFPDVEHMSTQPEYRPLKFQHYVFDFTLALQMRRNRAESLRELRATMAALTPPDDLPEPEPIDIPEPIAPAPAIAPKAAPKSEFVFIRFSSHRQRDNGLKAMERAGMSDAAAFYSHTAGDHRGIYMVTADQAHYLLNPALYCMRNAPTIMRGTGGLHPCHDTILTPSQAAFYRKLLQRQTSHLAQAA